MNRSNENLRVQRIAIDAEWDADTGIPVSVQICVLGGASYIFLNETMKLTPGFPESEIAACCEQNQIHLKYAPLADDAFNCIEYVFTLEGYDSAVNKNVECLMFFSPKDLWLATGFKNIRPYFEDGRKLVQKRGGNK